MPTLCLLAHISKEIGGAACILTCDGSLDGINGSPALCGWDCVPRVAKLMQLRVVIYIFPWCNFQASITYRQRVSISMMGQCLAAT